MRAGSLGIPRSPSPATEWGGCAFCAPGSGPRVQGRVSPSLRDACGSEHRVGAPGSPGDAQDRSLTLWTGGISLSVCRADGGWPGEKGCRGKEAPLGKVWAATPPFARWTATPGRAHTRSWSPGTAAPPTRPSETYGVLTRVQHAWWAEPWGRKSFPRCLWLLPFQAAGNLSAGVVNSPVL